MALDYAAARALLDECFAEVERAWPEAPGLLPAGLDEPLKLVFASQTQSFREVLLGCALARALDRGIDIRSPYVKQGPRAFNGRTLDEKVVNPFLRDAAIPASKGPYLATFRRGVGFVPETAAGIRDQAGYAGLLALVAALEAAEPPAVRVLLLHLLHRFLALRETTRITLARIGRLSLDQVGLLVGAMLAARTGGLAALLLSVALLRTLKACHGLDWDISFQGINAADAASGAGGDITLRRAGEVLLAVEVTEREIDRARVVATFASKISPAGIADYLFVHADAAPAEGARAAARVYFGQGHEMGFVRLPDWVVNTLASLGGAGRQRFVAEMLALLEEPGTPAAVKVAWNDAISAAIGS